MDTGNTVTVEPMLVNVLERSKRPIGVDMARSKFFFLKQGKGDVPDGKDTSSLSKASFLLNTTDSLLKDGGNLGGSGLGLRCVRTNLLGGSVDGPGNSRASLQGEVKFVNNSTTRVGWARMFQRVFVDPRDAITAPIELYSEMEMTELTGLRTKRTGMDSPRRSCQWQKQPQRHG